MKPRNIPDRNTRYAPQYHAAAALRLKHGGWTSVCLMVEGGVVAGNRRDRI